MAIVNRMRVYSLVGLAAWAVGCGAAEDSLEESGPEPEAPNLDTEETETPRVDMVGEALGTSERCATVAADQTISGGTTPWTTDRSYHHYGCSGAYIVDLNDYVPYVSEPTAPAWPASVECDEGLPSTENECERFRLVVYVWERSGGSTTYVGSSSPWAGWNGTHCVAPLVFLNSLAVTEGDDLRIAAACRKHEGPIVLKSYSRQRLRFSL